MSDKPFKVAKDFGVHLRHRPGKTRFLCIDPGDVHVGLAEFQRVGDGEWFCAWAGEMTPDEFLVWYVEGLRQARWDHVVCESWKLFPESAKFYVGSDMPTSRLIGAIAALAAFVPTGDDWVAEPEPKLYFQDPQIKVPTRGWLKRRKMRSVARILGVTADHATDAELHGYKHLIDAEAPIGNATAQAEFWKDRPRELSLRHNLW